MKCPKCGKEGVKYLKNRDRTRKTENRQTRSKFDAKCNKCGWRGEI